MARKTGGESVAGRGHQCVEPTRDRPSDIVEQNLAVASYHHPQVLLIGGARSQPRWNREITAYDLSESQQKPGTRLPGERQLLALPLLRPLCEVAFNTEVPLPTQVLSAVRTSHDGSNQVAQAPRLRHSSSDSAKLSSRYFIVLENESGKSTGKGEQTTSAELLVR